MVGDALGRREHFLNFQPTCKTLHMEKLQNSQFTLNILIVKCDGGSIIILEHFSSAYTIRFITVSGMIDGAKYRAILEKDNY